MERGELFNLPNDIRLSRGQRRRPRRASLDDRGGEVQDLLGHAGLRLKLRRLGLRGGFGDDLPALEQYEEVSYPRFRGGS